MPRGFFSLTCPGLRSVCLYSLKTGRENVFLLPCSSETSFIPDICSMSLSALQPCPLYGQLITLSLWQLKTFLNFLLLSYLFLLLYNLSDLSRCVLFCALFGLWKARFLIYIHNFPVCRITYQLLKGARHASINILSGIVSESAKKYVSDIQERQTRATTTDPLLCEKLFLLKATV